MDIRQYFCVVLLIQFMFLFLRYQKSFMMQNLENILFYQYFFKIAVGVDQGTTDKLFFLSADTDKH